MQTREIEKDHWQKFFDQVSRILIFIAEGTQGMDSLKVHSDDGTEQIVSFTEPLALPPVN
jgi:VCBS repeat-containing protein